MKRTVAALAVALVALGGGAIHLWRQLDASRQQIADLQARLKQMEAAQQAAADLFGWQLASLMGRAAPLVPTAPEASATPQTTPPSTVVAGISSEMLATLRQRAASPEGRAQARRLKRSTLFVLYPELGKQLNLSVEEANKLFDVLAQHEVALEEDGREVIAAGNTAEYKRMAEASTQAAEADLVAMLGSRYPQWQQYKDTLPGLRQVIDLRPMLIADGNPLSDAQARPLIAAVAAEDNRMDEEAFAPMQSGRSYQEALRLRTSSESTNRLVNAAAPYLNPQQLERYRQMLERDREYRRTTMSVVE